MTNEEKLGFIIAAESRVRRILADLKADNERQPTAAPKCNTCDRPHESGLLKIFFDLSGAGCISTGMLRVPVRFDGDRLVFSEKVPEISKDVPKPTPLGKKFLEGFSKSLANDVVFDAFQVQDENSFRWIDADGVCPV